MQIIADSGEYVVSKVNKSVDSSYDYGKKTMDGVMKRWGRDATHASWSCLAPSCMIVLGQPHNPIDLIRCLDPRGQQVCHHGNQVAHCFREGRRDEGDACSTVAA